MQIVRVQEFIANAIQDIGGVRPDQITSSALIGKGLRITGQDSIDLLEAIEQEFGIDLRPVVEVPVTYRPFYFPFIVKRGIEGRDFTVDELAMEVIALIEAKSSPLSPGGGN